MFDLGIAKPVFDLVDLNDIRALFDPRPTLSPRDASHGLTGLTIPWGPLTTETIAVGETRYETLDYFGDRDGFRIDLAAYQAVAISLVGIDHDATNGLGGVTNSELTIYDSNGAVLASNSYHSGTDAFLELTSATGGSFFIDASAYTFFDRGDYALSVSAIPPPVDTVAGDITTTETFAEGDFLTGSIETLGDRDWYRFDLAAYDTARFGIYATDHTTGNGLAELQNPYLRIYDSSGTLVSGTAESNEFWSFLDFTSLSGGTYYVESSALDDQFIGDYQMVLFQDTGTLQGTVSMGQVVRDTLPDDGDKHFYQMDLSAGDTMRIALNGLDHQRLGKYPDGLFDPVLKIFDSSGNLVALNDDRPWAYFGDASYNSLMYFTPDQTGTYFIQVDSQDGFYSGEYTLRLRNAPDIAASPLQTSLDNRDIFLFRPDAGHLSFDGGAGKDVADYSVLTLADVSAVNLGDGDWVVTHLDSGATDTLSSVETLIFADTLLTA